MGTRKVNNRSKSGSSLKRCILAVLDVILDCVVATLVLAAFGVLVHYIFFCAAFGWKVGCSMVPDSITLNIRTSDCCAEFKQ